MLEDELLHSREVLGEKLALPVGKIAIPYGRYSLRILRACAAAGYQQVYTSSPWTGTRSHCGVRVCGRFSVRSTLDPAELKRLLTLSALPYLYRQSKSHGKEAVKMLLGDRFYTSIWVSRIRSVLAMFAVTCVLAHAILWPSLDLILTS